MADSPDNPTGKGHRPHQFEPPDPAELQRLLPGLEVLELIGRGGMGAVYKARQPNLDRLAALKILPAEMAAEAGFAERFTLEAQAMAKLHHPNIVTVFDFGTTEGGLFYLIMEFVDGVTLHQAIQSGTIDAPQALAILSRVCEALQFAHDRGVVHRDIKPGNILLGESGEVKVTDFGLAKLFVEDQPTTSLTVSGAAMGTPDFMAPEQMEDTSTVDHRADIYSLGVLFYQLLTGQLPRGVFDPPSRKVPVDTRLDQIVLKAMQHDPDRRYQQVSEITTEIEKITSSPLITARTVAAPARQPTLPHAAPHIPPAPRARPAAVKKPKKRTPSGATLLVLSLLSLGGLGWFFYTQVPELVNELLFPSRVAEDSKQPGSPPAPSPEPEPASGKKMSEPAKIEPPATITPAPSAPDRKNVAAAVPKQPAPPAPVPAPPEPKTAPAIDENLAPSEGRTRLLAALSPPSVPEVLDHWQKFLDSRTERLSIQEERYLTALRSEARQASADGDDKLFDALRAENERVESGEPFDDRLAPGAHSRLRDIHRIHSGILSNVEVEVLDASAAYLSKLQDTIAREGRSDDAFAVKAFRESLVALASGVAGPPPAPDRPRSSPVTGDSVVLLFLPAKNNPEGHDLVPLNIASTLKPWSPAGSGVLTLKPAGFEVGIGGPYVYTAPSDFTLVDFRANLWLAIGIDRPPTTFTLECTLHRPGSPAVQIGSPGAEVPGTDYSLTEFESGALDQDIREGDKLHFRIVTPKGGTLGRFQFRNRTPNSHVELRIRPPGAPLE